MDLACPKGLAGLPSPSAYMETYYGRVGTKFPGMNRAPVIKNHLRPIDQLDQLSSRTIDQKFVMT